MICKKCGSNVELPAKFCVYCGTLLDEEKIVQAPVNQTTVLNPVNQPVQPKVVNTPVENPTTLNSVEPTVEQPINQTTVLNPVNQPVQPNVVNTPVENPTTLNSVEPTVEQPVNQTTVLNAVNQPVQPTVTQPVDPNLVNAQVDNSSTLSNNVLQQKKKKSKAWIFVVLAILLVGVAATIYFLVFNKQNSIQVLQKSLYNMVKKGENSATLNVNLLLEAEDKIDLSAIIKYKKEEDSHNLSLTLNKSELFDEINLYSTIKNKNLVLYAKSNLVDMLGFTSSPKEMWLNYNIDLEELKEDYEDTKNNIDLFEILDEEHFKYVDEENSIKHYQLIVDKDLLLKLENKLSDETKETLEITKNQESVVENMIYYVDFYINKSYEITKISIDMTDQIMDETYKKFVLEFEFMNFGKTNLEIPKEAKESTMNIENYMTTYSLYQEIEENTLSN